MTLGRLGVWYGTDKLDAAQLGDFVGTVEKLGYSALWYPESRGYESLSLAGYIPSKDAFQVKKIKEAGAIVIAKSNMAEWAFTPNETLSSILPGYTKNPYALDRVTAGSSGGTAAAVAASSRQ